MYCIVKLKEIEIESSEKKKEKEKETNLKASNYVLLHPTHTLALGCCGF